MINVLSLFDGMSCGRIALDRIGQPVGLYARSEIDKHASIVARANYPLSYDVGDVTKWREWPLDWSEVDLVMGGSPCQGFSAAGKQGGTKAKLHGQEMIVDTREKYLIAKQMGAEFLSQSHLFWEFVLIVDHVRQHNPNVKILLENVVMSRPNLDMITRALGVGEPVLINSALVSAQNRRRYYWCNWDVEQPEDRDIVLADILEGDHVDREKAHCLDANCYKGGNLKSYFEKNRRQLVFKTVTFNDRIKGVTEDDRGIRYNKGDKAKSGISELGRILKPGAAYTDALTTSHMPKLALNSDVANLQYRGLTPIECERLQTVPDNYTNHVSNTQRYKMLGNGWTVDVIAHILKEGGFGK